MTRLPPHLAANIKCPATPEIRRPCLADPAYNPRHSLETDLRSRTCHFSSALVLLGLFEDAIGPSEQGPFRGWTGTSRRREEW
jgi:hypothetical protein